MTYKREMTRTSVYLDKKHKEFLRKYAFNDRTTQTDVLWMIIERFKLENTGKHRRAESTQESSQ